MQSTQQSLSLVARPCTRCGHDLVDPASVQAGIGPVCRGYANQILAKEIPTAWNDEKVGALLFLPVASFPVEAQERFSLVYDRVMLSKGVNQTAPHAGDDWRATVKELVYLASVAASTAIFETLMGVVEGIGYGVYAAFVSGKGASGEATVTYEHETFWFRGVRNPIGQEALRKVGALYAWKNEVWLFAQPDAREFLRVVRVYWPFVKGVSEALAKAANTYSLEAHPAGQVLLLRFSKNEPFVEEFLAKVPWFDRHLDTQEGCWRVRTQHQATLEGLLSRFFPR